MMPLYILKVMVTDRRARPMYEMTLTMLHAIRDSSRRREAPNTTPVVFTSRQYTRSTTAGGGRGGVSVHHPANQRPELHARPPHEKLITLNDQIHLIFASKIQDF